MEKYIVRIDGPEKFVVMHKSESHIFYDVAITTNEYWACRIADALIFEDKMSSKSE